MLNCLRHKRYDRGAFVELTDRKKQILKVVVEDYIQTAEPVGSKAIAAEMGGKGGGSPTLAQGGAPSSKDLDKAFAAAPKLFEGLMAKGK